MEVDDLVLCKCSCGEIQAAMEIGGMIQHARDCAVLVEWRSLSEEAQQFRIDYYKELGWGELKLWLKEGEKSSGRSYQWYHIYCPKRPHMIYGNVVAKSKSDAIKVLNLRDTAGVYIDEDTVIAVELPTEVSDYYIEEYHKKFDENVFLRLKEQGIIVKGPPR